MVTRFFQSVARGERTNRVDVVFETYRDISIKSAERELRGESDAITFKNLAAGQKVKQFKNFLHNGDNKKKSYQNCCGTLAKSTKWRETGRQGAVRNVETDATRSLLTD